MGRKETRRRMDRKIVEMLGSGQSLRQIMKLLHVGVRRIIKVKSLAEQRGYLGDNPVPLPAYPEAIFPDIGKEKSEDALGDAEKLLIPKKDWIKERLLAGWHPITVFEEIGLAVSRASFYRFLITHDLREIGSSARRVVPEIVHEPGEALLLDWGKLRDVIDETGKKRTLWAFIGVLGFSRYAMVRLVWSNDVATTMDAIQSMLREIGGVPKRITSDNPKCFSLEASKFEPLLNPAFERLAAHYNFLIECLPPRSPEKKGKVERLMPFARRLYEAHGDAWHGLQESQAYMDRKVAIANERKHGTTRQQPFEQLLNLEASALRPLPALSYAPETVSYGVVRRDGHVRFENRYYSVEESFIGQKVVVLGGANDVSIYHNGNLIEVHARLSDDWRSKSTKPEHLKVWEREMQNDHEHLKRARAIGPNVERLIEGILEQQEGFLDTRKIWGVLSLDKSHPKDRIDDACNLAFRMGSFSYRTVKYLLKMPLQDDPPSQQNTTAGVAQHKFVRPLTVYKEQLKKMHN